MPIVTSHTSSTPVTLESQASRNSSPAFELASLLPYFKKIFKEASKAFLPKKGLPRNLSFLNLDQIKVEQRSAGKISHLLRALQEHSKSLSCEDSKHLMYLSCMELLAKNLAYCKLKKGLSFSLPFKDATGRLSWAQYEVDHIFHLGSTVPAYALKPVDASAPPVLIFRGTVPPSLENLINEPASIKTWEADLDPNGVGNTQVQELREDLQNWLSSHPNKALLLGHSLGGGYATQTALMCHEQVQQVITFNAPLARKEHKEFYDSLSIVPDFLNFSSCYDMISKLGGGALIGAHFEISGVQGLIGDIHSNLVFLAASSFALQEVDVELANKSYHLDLLDRLNSQATKRVSSLAKFIFDHLSIIHI